MTKNFQVITIDENGIKGSHPSRGAKTAKEAVEIAKRYMTWREMDRVVEYQVTTLDGSLQVETFKA